MTSFEKLVDDALIAQGDPRTGAYYRIDAAEWNRVKACLIACHERGETLLPPVGDDPFAGILPDTRPQAGELEEAAAAAAQIAPLALKEVIASYHRQISRETAKRILDGLRALSETPGNAMVFECFPGYRRNADGFAADWDAANADRRRLSDTTDSPISARRKAAGMTQAELAAALGTDQRSISRWENGDVEPRASVLVKMAAILACDIKELV